ncbi:MAG TPA: hypothetical protein VGM51_18450 [Armatimonadota bacterium]|jgi:hypothetical protein
MRLVPPDSVSPAGSGNSPPANGESVIAAWAVTLAVSILPDIIYQSVAGSRPAWLLTAKLGVLAAIILAGYVLTPARRLRLYCVMLFALLSAGYLSAVIGGSGWWQGLFSGRGFSRQMLGEQILRVGAAGAMIAVLFLLRFRPADVFLVRGHPNAPAAPVRWLGIDKPIGWNRLGAISALCVSLGTLAFLVIAGRPAA